MAKRRDWREKTEASSAGRVNSRTTGTAARFSRGSASAMAFSIAAGLLVTLPASQAFAAEGGFSSYGLGTSAFSAGVTPPPGTYVSAGLAAIRGDIKGTLTFGGIAIDVGMQ